MMALLLLLPMSMPADEFRIDVKPTTRDIGRGKGGLLIPGDAF
jgi:hypothetical protein